MNINIYPTSTFNKVYFLHNSGSAMSYPHILNESASALLLSAHDQSTDGLIDTAARHSSSMTTSSNSSFPGRGGPARDMPGTETLRQVVLVVYLACFCFGLVGNILVLGIIGYYKNIRTKSVANYYIWSLSLADLLFILTLPFFSYTTFTSDWPFGNAMCKITFAFRETNRFSSVFLLVALSWDRFIASFYNLSHLRTIRLGIVICVIIWIICVTLSMH